jgi:predicted DNA-binding protein
MAARGVKPRKGSSAGKPTRRAVASVTKKVRMTEEEARRLARVSHARGKSESEVLREGILLAEREEKRLQAIEKLARMAEEAGPEPAPPRWRSA